MREILFRGKVSDTKEWIMGDLISHTYEKPNIRPIGTLSSYIVIPETVGQYTGLNDNNGTPIYEGDIVEARLRPIAVFSKCYVIGKVVFKNGTFKISVYKSENAKEYKEYTDENIKEYPIENNFINRNYQLKIIGNIYDNPELLKGE